MQSMPSRRISSRTRPQRRSRSSIENVGNCQSVNTGSRIGSSVVATAFLLAGRESRYEARWGPDGALRGRCAAQALGGVQHRVEDLDVAAAAAEVAAQILAHLVRGGVRILLQQGLSAKNEALSAERALET